MMTPRITIGMAVCNDSAGAWATVQSICLHNEWDNPDDVEILIVDNSPKGSDCPQILQDFVNWGGHPEGRTRNIRYIRMPDTPSTTLPRELVVREAAAPFVCVVDCHVLLPINGYKKLLDWFDTHPNFNGLIHGPLLYDNLHKIDTAFADQFRGGMWGTWSNAWYDPTSDIYFCVEPEEVTDEHRPRQPNKDGMCSFRDVITLEEVFVASNIKYAGHEKALKELGFIEAGRDDKGPAFKIPGQGMGLFATVKKHWMGFDTRCKGFGGEELNIHTKYREADREVLCLPFLKWNHRFGREGGTPYANPHIAKVRNYVLWADSHKNRERQLARIYTHFVKSGMITQDQWTALLQDPANYPIDLTPPSQKRADQMGAVEQLYFRVMHNDPDMKGYAEIVRGIAGMQGIRHVSAIVKRASWEPVLAAGFPEVLNVYQYQDNPYTKEAHEAHKLQDNKNGRVLVTYNTIPVRVPAYEVDAAPGDLLVIDHINTGEYLYQTLNVHHHKFQLIMIRGTQTFGETSEGSTDPGLWDGMRRFLSINTDWFVAQHWQHNYGMTMLARDPNPRPENEVRPWPKGYGPGTELKKILSSVGINPPVGCKCRSRMLQMDEWGIEGCETNFNTIVGWLEESAEEWGWNLLPKTIAESNPEHEVMTLKQKLSIGWAALTKGLIFKVNWTDPYPGLVRLSIEQAKFTKDPWTTSA